MSKLFAILGLDQALALADSIKRRGKAFDRDVQALAVSAIGYANIHGDITIANRIIPSMPGGSRKQAVVNLLEGLGCLKYDGKSKTFSHVKRDDVVRDPVALVEMMSTKEYFWTTYTPAEEVVSSVDVLEQVGKLVKRIVKMQKKAEEAGVQFTLENAPALVALQAMVPADEATA